MNIYKLKYTDKETAISDLILKQVIDEKDTYQQGIHSVVEIGLINLENGTYDNEGNEITPPTFVEGYHYDIMCEQEIVFDNTITPNNPKHKFAGC